LQDASNITEHVDRLAIAAACALIGDRWSLPIVAALLEGPRRFGEIQERVPAIAPNILSARLRSLEQDGLVLAQRYSRRPPRFEYALSSDGEALVPALGALAAWASRRSGVEPPTHALCGTELELQWWCPTCQEPAVLHDEAATLA